MRQPGLTGLGPPPGRELHRLFFALWPGADERAAMALRARELGEAHQPGGRLIHPRRYHLTLQFLGDFDGLPSRLVEQALAAVARVHVPPFQLELDLAGSFRNRAIPWWLGCMHPPDELEALFTALSRALASQGVQVRSQGRLQPHVTIVRDAARALPATPIDPVAWPVDRVVLVHSVLGSRSEYHLLGSQRLA